MDVVAAIHQTFAGAKGGRPRIKSEARSASIITIAFICADGISGSDAASTRAGLRHRGPSDLG